MYQCNGITWNQYLISKWYYPSWTYNRNLYWEQLNNAPNSKLEEIIPNSYPFVSLDCQLSKLETYASKDGIFFVNLFHNISYVITGLSEGYWVVSDAKKIASIFCAHSSEPSAPKVLPMVLCVVPGRSHGQVQLLSNWACKAPGGVYSLLVYWCQHRFFLIEHIINYYKNNGENSCSNVGKKVFLPKGRKQNWKIRQHKLLVAAVNEGNSCSEDGNKGEHN